MGVKAIYLSLAKDGHDLTYRERAVPAPVMPKPPV